MVTPEELEEVSKLKTLRIDEVEIDTLEMLMM